MRHLVPVLALFLVSSCCTCDRAVAPDSPGSSTAIGYDTRTIDRLAWSDREFPRSDSAGRAPYLLGHVAVTEEWTVFKAFTAAVDQRFRVESEGERFTVRHGTGGASSGDDFYVMLRPRDWTPESGRTYRVEPVNDSGTHRWLLPAGGLSITR